MSKKLLKSLSILAVAAIVIIGGTMAYFNDTETSTGNKFTAGKFNLLVGSDCTYNGEVVEECNWLKKDLEDELFFNFDDIKPGDSGENTVTLKVDNNDAWICAELANLVNDDNNCEAPENKLDQTCGAGEGELAANLFFTIWKDNGAGANACNNILDTDETAIVSDQSAENLLWPIADSEHGPAITGDTDYCLGISWNVPIGTSNIIQTDSLMGNVVFNAVQARNMDNFKCSDLYTEVCDGKDNNYNDQIDEGELWTNKGQTCSVGVGACSATGNYICDANNPAGATICSAAAGTAGEEICGNGLDDDCDGQVDEGFLNYDGDSMADCVDPDDDNDGFNDDADCNDNNANIYPDAPEYCNGIDENCNGYIDDAPQDYVFVYRDADGDGYGNPLDTLSCRTSGYVENDHDCNDTNSAIRPGATEICNGVDDDCDGRVDEGLSCLN